LQKEKIEHFEKEYSELAAKDLVMAKQYFREKFLVTCFGCDKLIRLTKDMCCPECGTYLD